jgi:hypothetical protein
MKHLIIQFFQPPVISSLLAPNIRNIRDKVSLLYRNTDRIVVLYIVLFTLYAAEEKTERSGPSESKRFPNSTSS